MSGFRQPRDNKRARYDGDRFWATSSGSNPGKTPFSSDYDRHHHHQPPGQQQHRGHYHQSGREHHRHQNDRYQRGDNYYHRDGSDSQNYYGPDGRDGSGASSEPPISSRQGHPPMDPQQLHRNVGSGGGGGRSSWNDAQRHYLPAQHDRRPPAAARQGPYYHTQQRNEGPDDRGVFWAQDGRSDAEPPTDVTVDPCNGKPKYTVDKEWKDMTWKEKNETLLEAELPNFPMLKMPPCFQERHEHAIAETKECLKKAHAKELAEDKKQGKSKAAFSSDEESDDGMVVKVTRTDQVTATDPLDECMPFIRSLQECAGLYPGFHAVTTTKGADKWCYCPCGREMRAWRDRFKLGDVHDGACNHQNKKFTPNGLMDHLGKLSENNQNKFHKIAEHYLRSLYSDYWRKGLHHKALYHLGDKNYKLAEVEETKEMQSIIDHLQVELDLQRQKMEKLKAKEKQIEELQKVNEELKWNLDVEKKIRKHLRIGEQVTTIELSEKELERYRVRYGHDRKIWKKELQLKQKELMQKRIPKRTDTDMRIEVKPKFSLDECLHNWLHNAKLGDEHDSTFLFRELDDSNAVLLLSQGNVEYTAAVHLESEEDRSQYRAVDEGGPTREFLSEVWIQMGDLQLRIERDEPLDLGPYQNAPADNTPKRSDDDSTRLFSGCKARSGCFLPQTDEYIKTKLKNNVDAFQDVLSIYRAFGRIMLYALGMGQPIASHVMPDIYRNYLLRGVSPLDEDYALVDLVYHVVTLFEYKRSENEIEGMMKEFMGIMGADESMDESSQEDSEEKFRKFADRLFIKNRTEILEAILAGLTLNDRINMKLAFGTVPCYVVDKLLFAKQNIDVEDIINALRHSNDIDLDANHLQILNIQESVGGKKVVTGILPDILRDRAEDRPEFLEEFVHFATSYKFVPHCNFQIIVEFAMTWDPEEGMEEGDLMSSEALPRAHTCENTIALPWFAYDGSREKLEQKLDEAFRHCKTTVYDMT